MTPQRLCFFLPSLAGGGAERSFMLLANGAVARGHPVDLVLARKYGPWLAQVDPRVRVVDLEGRRTATTILPLARYLRATRPAAILSALDQANVVAVMARALSRTRPRLVVSIRLPIGVATRAGGSFRQRTTRALARRLYRAADMIVTISDGVRDDFIATFGYPPARVRTIYNPIVDAAFRERAERPAPAALPGDGVPLIVAVGRLRPVKGFDDLIRAFAGLRRGRPARLLILGEGPERPKLEALAAELGVAGDVLLPGFDPNPLPCLKAASVFVSSSVWEGFGNAVVEAMALGVPVVATRTEGPAEILEQGRWGRLVPIGDPEAMAVALAAALDDPGPDPRERARQFSVERSVDEYLAAALPDSAP